MKHLILVIEDDESIRELITMNLQAVGFDVKSVGDGTQALDYLRSQTPDLILLDWMLPGLDGMDVLRHLKVKEAWAKIPVIMLTAKSEESDIVLGLEMGAADYVTKPFSHKVLIARIRSLLRRGDTFVEETIRHHGLVIMPGLRTVTLHDQNINLSANEFDILTLLAMRPGHVFTRSQIITRTKGDYCAISDRAVDVALVTLRKKLGDYGERIETIRGVGYRMRP